MKFNGVFILKNLYVINNNRLKVILFFIYECIIYFKKIKNFNNVENKFIFIYFCLCLKFSVI